MVFKHNLIFNPSLIMKRKKLQRIVARIMQRIVQRNLQSQQRRNNASIWIKDCNVGDNVL